ncbi:1600014C23Rik [Phodopus roborovskii]|uniref:1600014C23Rik protein n=1 Tax=Phodopus roborovskii TaxID=109678 RepID=A0AAV0A5T4_PHORO|nr:1600014C23Rik [Phodopus roborovskii]
MEIISWALNRELSSLSIKHPVLSSTHPQTGTEGGLSLGQHPLLILPTGSPGKGGGWQHPPARNPACAPDVTSCPFFPAIPFTSPQVLGLAEEPARAIGALEDGTFGLHQSWSLSWPFMYVVERVLPICSVWGRGILHRIACLKPMKPGLDVLDCITWDSRNEIPLSSIPHNPLPQDAALLTLPA